MDYLPTARGKSSNATKHLNDTHKIIAHKTQVEIGRKRDRDSEIEQLESCPLFSRDPQRLYQLLATRNIVMNNMPFRSSDYEDSQLIARLMFKDQFRAPMSAKVVTHCIVEMYSAAKREVVRALSASRAAGLPCFSLVADFWTSSVQNTKYLGVRAYFVDSSWTFRSVLLGTRAFTPSFMQRSNGIRAPFKAWLLRLTSDFGLRESDLFGAMSDAGSDVRWMLSSGLGLQWEWCIAHLTNAAMKHAIGLEPRSMSKNPDITELIESVRLTVRTVKEVETTGTLFQALCQLEGKDKSVRLLSFQAHRFLGLVRVLERLLEKWPHLERWFAEREKAASRGTARPFPLTGLTGKQEMIEQLLSVLLPVKELNAASQAEEATQVPTLLRLYQLHMTTLNEREALKDYRSTKGNEMYTVGSAILPQIDKT